MNTKQASVSLRFKSRCINIKILSAYSTHIYISHKIL